jgi:hypothetical protein
MLRQATNSRFSVRLFCLLHDVRLTITQTLATVINRNRSMTANEEDGQDEGKLLSCLTYTYLSHA